MINRIYWKPPFEPARVEQLLTAMLQVHRGAKQFPGDVRESPHWPGFAPGRYGPINALSPLYNRQWFERIMRVDPKPPLLWIYGCDDAIVTDRSLSDAGTQGQLGFREGWPGEDVFPPQPLLTQVTAALEAYERSGGNVTRLVIEDAGHTPYLENPTTTHLALIKFLTSASRL